MPVALEAGLWGLLASSSLLLGAALGWFLKLPKRLTAGVMAFGSGVLFSAVAFDLIEEGFEQAGLAPVVAGCLIGAFAYAGANLLVNRAGGHHRKRSGNQQENAGGGAIALAIGALLDGVPESVVLGAGLLTGGVSTSMFAAVFLSNLPEGLSSAAGMKQGGRSLRYTFGLWGGIVLASGMAAWAGAQLLGGAPAAVLAGINALAAGAILTMIVDTMIPEAVEVERGATGVLALLGLLAAFALSKFGG